METTTLGPFTVSRLCLGTMLMGAATPVDESHRILDRFTDAGGNFVDTADVYSDGGSEETLAPWLARRRGDVVLATKLRFAVSDPGGDRRGARRDDPADRARLAARRRGSHGADRRPAHAGAARGRARRRRARADGRRARATRGAR